MLGEYLGLIGLIIASFMFGLFLLSVLIKRNGIADIAWGMGIFLVALSSYLASP